MPPVALSSPAGAVPGADTSGPVSALLADNHDIISLKLYQLTVERTAEEEKRDREVYLPVVDNLKLPGSKWGQGEGAESTAPHQQTSRAPAGIRRPVPRFLSPTATQSGSQPALVWHRHAWRRSAAFQSVPGYPWSWHHQHELCWAAQTSQGLGPWGCSLLSRNVPP